MKNFENYIWYERYRPTEMDQMVLPKKWYSEKFEEYIEEQEIPHLLFFGPNGSGKTTMANILMNKIKCQSLVLNASGEDRGIDTIKGKVKQFAASQPLTKDTLKIIFLDEADYLTTEAQRALRNTMETYSKTCRFILTGNYIDKIKREIKSRCTCFEFSQYSKKRLLKTIFTILEYEKVKAKEEDIINLINAFYPDIRSIYNNLQLCSANGKFNPEFITSTSIDFNSLTTCLLHGKVRSLRKLLIGMNEYLPIYKYLFDDFIYKVDKTMKSEVSEIVAEYLFRDASIADREINITMACMMIMKTLCIKIKFEE